jgi:hypothetical protein
MDSFRKYIEAKGQVDPNLNIANRNIQPFPVDPSNDPGVSNLSDKTNHHIRWLINRDLPQVVRMKLKLYKIPNHYKKVIKMIVMAARQGKNAQEIFNWLRTENGIELGKKDIPGLEKIVKATNDIDRTLNNRNIIGMVAEDGPKILGYMIYSLEKDHLEVIEMEALPGESERQIYQDMITKLKSKLSSHRRTHLLMSHPEDKFDSVRSRVLAQKDNSGQGFSSAYDRQNKAINWRYDYMNPSQPGELSAPKTGDPGYDYQGVKKIGRARHLP